MVLLQAQTWAERKRKTPMEIRSQQKGKQSTSLTMWSKHPRGLQARPGRAGSWPQRGSHVRPTQRFQFHIYSLYWQNSKTDGVVGLLVPLSSFCHSNAPAHHTHVAGASRMQPCPAGPGDQKGLEVCLKMNPLWANVFMMLAMFLQSSASQRKNRRDVESCSRVRKQ